ncbi:MAG: gliding motility-associated C-terminal domain-containing protein [Paludibacteraceae bacterium]|nr:gliding motility-associated C-terminal domain-containing protein [Paludibacteraceae bacterium]
MKLKLLAGFAALLISTCSWAATSTPTCPTTQYTQPEAVTHATCYDKADGSVTVYVNGGVIFNDQVPYKVLLTRNNTSITNFTVTFNAQTEGHAITIDGLQQGSYLGVIQDNSSCTLNIQFNIEAPQPLNAAITAINHVLCHGENSGNIQLAINGGTAPYTATAYTQLDDPNSQVSTGQTLTDNILTLNQLPANYYYIKIVDANGCEQWKEATVTEPTAPLTYQPYANTIQCSGASTGKIFGEATGGTLPYTYTLTGVNVTKNVTNTDGLFEELPMGVYSLTVTDKNGCTASPDELVSITESETLTVDPLTKLPAATVVCKDDKTASVTFTVAGRVQPVAPSDTARYYSVRLFDITRQQELIVPNLKYSNRFHPVITKNRTEKEPVLDPDGNPTYNENGDPITKNVTYRDTLWAEGCHEPTKAEEVYKVSKFDYTEDLKGFDCDDKITVSGLGAGAYSIMFYQGECQFGETMTFTVEVTGSLPQVQINDVANFCDGSTYTIKPTIIATPGISKYEWTLNDTHIGSAKDLEHTFVQAENEQVLMLKATNRCGSSTSNSVKVTVRQRPTAVLTTDKGYLCQNQSANISIAFKGTAPFVYQLPNQEVAESNQAMVSQQVTPLESTTYSLEQLQDAYCQANIEQDVENTHIVVYQEPDYSMDVTIPDPMISGSYVTVTATPGFESYTLLVNNQEVLPTQLPNEFKTKKFAYGTTDNIFALQVSDNNGCNWELSEIHTITSQLFPNIFTPNGDGVNDILLADYAIRVFDRQGNLVYQGESGWDGTINGKPANQGVYLYVVEVTDATGKSYTHKLTITLQR